MYKYIIQTSKGITYVTASDIQSALNLATLSAEIGEEIFSIAKLNPM